MKQELIIRSLPQAFDLVKQMGLSEDWEVDYRVSGRRALGLLPSPDRSDPNFCFEKWQEIERNLATTSCFYVAAKNAIEAGASTADVFYDFRHPAIVEAL